MKIYSLSKIAIVLSVLLIFILLGALWRVSAVPQTSLIVQDEQFFEVKPGANMTSVLRELAEKEVIEPSFWQSVWIKSNPKLANIQQGWYQLSIGMTLLNFVQKLHVGHVVEHKITLVEGFTVWQWLEQMAATGDIIIDVSYDHDAFEYQFTPLSKHHQMTIREGYFAPDTYAYAHQAKASDILFAAYAKQRQQLKALMSEFTLPKFIHNEHELLTLASIVEKETGTAKERPIIAGVFLSRLAKNMRLQTDPTIIYGIGPSFNGDITYADLRAKTPYNTYRINGLTPTPIANPSLASIKAVLAPEQTDALYFVARGDGTHEFSKTLAAHNKAVKKYQLTKP
ncbi:endolytic transglycosylase MltG [Opacimonas viscosa]|uniref:Endolytic murein transglycosylase n=1 Tax=Opacimonas viscosa TaxID=2961944 RepID=A0AA41X0P2_9ALTE|nr:endolytic transglycosylase MltG [Opacimonas viscosa]MCP3427356.1 endolytic transglycosylase MltG [Opacimonas viscosa]